MHLIYFTSVWPMAYFTLIQYITWIYTKDGKLTLDLSHLMAGIIIDKIMVPNQIRISEFRHNLCELWFPHANSWCLNMVSRINWLLECWLSDKRQSNKSIPNNRLPIIAPVNHLWLLRKNLLTTCVVFHWRNLSFTLL